MQKLSAISLCKRLLWSQSFQEALPPPATAVLPQAEACLLQKMPTIVVYKDGEKVAEHIAAEGGPDAVDKVRRCIVP